MSRYYGLRLWTESDFNHPSNDGNAEKDYNEGKEVKERTIVNMLKRLFGVLLIGIGLLLLIINVLRMDWLQESINGPSVEFSERKVIPSTDLDRIQIRTDIAHLSVGETGGDEIEVRLRGNMEQEWRDNLRFEVRQEGNQAAIELLLPPNPKLSFGMSAKELELDVLLPDKRFEEIDIRSSIGTINIENIQVDQLQAKTNVGKISLLEVRGVKTELKTDVGLIFVEKVGGELDITSNTGKIDVLLEGITSDVRIKSNTGKVNVYSKNKPSSLKLDLRSDIGRVEVSMKDLDYEENLNREVIGTIGSGAPLVKIRTNVGKIDFEAQ
ncbi:DUF4097 family beta strand repeat-containing protein [Ammoniphilus sp. YIM 78166]|uniref:DUF4097 family beta strand repeat-containing protein n=1 Tax=Ammoniphilus sp. YIM 78166 TaxID=1644106 RepID=UPI001431A6A2|nr:DUF4097 family beta strand repeat-containing protein [Ammoniphilus sp. YIM 78166]